MPTLAFDLILINHDTIFRMHLAEWTVFKADWNPICVRGKGEQSSSPFSHFRYFNCICLHLTLLLNPIPAVSSKSLSIWPCLGESPPLSAIFVISQRFTKAAIQQRPLQTY